MHKYLRPNTRADALNPCAVMKHFVRIMLVAAAMGLLGVYFFADRPLFSDKVEMLSWEEFSQDHAAMARLKAEVQADEGEAVDLRAAFEARTARVNLTQQPQTSVRDQNTEVARIKSHWTRVYAALTPSVKHFSWAPVFVRRFVYDHGSRIGIGLVFGLLAAAVGGLTWLILIVERKVQP